MIGTVAGQLTPYFHYVLPFDVSVIFIMIEPNQVL